VGRSKIRQVDGGAPAALSPPGGESDGGLDGKRYVSPPLPDSRLRALPAAFGRLADGVVRCGQAGPTGVARRSGDRGAV
jgi:hypothetical protein